MATNTASKTANYGLSQYVAGDLAKFLTNYNSDMLAIDGALKAIKDESDAAVPSTRKILGNSLSADITLAQLISAGLCPAPESGSWDAKLYGEAAVGSPTYATTEAATWTKIGKFVMLRFSIALTSLGGIAGILHIKTLPFPISSKLSGFAAVFAGTSHSDATGIYFNGDEGQNTMYIKVATSGMIPWTSSATDISDTFAALRCMAFYETEA